MNKRTHCFACKSNQIQSIETISTIELAKVWSKSDIEAGQTILKYLEQGSIPETVYIDKCRVCGLEFANPTFAADAEWYAKIEKYGMRWEYSQCLKDLQAHKRQAVLEVGCGEGYFLEFITRNGTNIVGLDFNKSAIQVSRSKGMEAYTCNLKETMEILNKQFDAVTFFHVIEHLDDPDRFFADLSVIMPVGSTLHLSCPGPKRFTTPLEHENKVGLRDMWDYPPLHQTRWNQKAVDKILSRFGWSLKKYVEEPFHWTGVSIFLVSKKLAASGFNPLRMSPLEWKMRIVNQMIRTFIPSLKYKGMSMYCMAVRQ